MTPCDHIKRSVIKSFSALLILLSVACAGSSPEGDATQNQASGVMAGNPEQPKKQLIEDFFPEFSMGFLSNRAFIGLDINSLRDKLNRLEYPESKLVADGFLRYNSDIILYHGLFSDLNLVELATLPKLDELGIDAANPPAEDVVIVLPELGFLSSRANFDIIVRAQSGHEGYLRFDFLNKQDNAVEASYVVRFVDGKPRHGMLTYINVVHAKLLEAENTGDHNERLRFLELSYEIDDEGNSYLQMSQVRSSGLFREIAVDFRSMCLAGTQQCDGQELFINAIGQDDDDITTREFSPMDLAYASLADGSQCVALIDYAQDGSFSLSPAVQVISTQEPEAPRFLSSAAATSQAAPQSPAQPASPGSASSSPGTPMPIDRPEDRLGGLPGALPTSNIGDVPVDVALNSCKVNPIFGRNGGFFPEMLPLRTMDTVPRGGTAREIYAGGDLEAGLYSRKLIGKDDILNLTGK